MSRIFNRSLLATALLCCAGFAAAQEATQAQEASKASAAAFVEQANQAYERKDFAASAELFTRAIGAGDRSGDTYYNAACAYALAGDKDRAFDMLGLAVHAGFDSVDSLDFDKDLASLRGDLRMTSLRESIFEQRPDLRMTNLLSNQQLSLPKRYFPAQRALAEGMQPKDGKASTFSQMYAMAAAMMGDYDEAGRNAQISVPKGVDPIADGYLRAVPANDVIVQKAKDRQVVFLNESHGNAETRAANYSLLAPLRKEGFKYLALETLDTAEPKPAKHGDCAVPQFADAELASRGYPLLKKTGYYTDDPVYAELVREALRLGYVLVAYDGGGNKAPREQFQADALACVLKHDPKARLLVIAGHGHIIETPDQTYPGGMMAYRFRKASGIDPLTINTTALLGTDPAKLRFPAKDRGRSSQGYLLLDGKGRAYGGHGADLYMYVRSTSHRNDPGGSWLELGGARKPTSFAAEICGQRLPCMIEARAKGEAEQAVDGDRCVVWSAADSGCTLYLRPGSYMIRASDERQLIKTMERKVP